MTLLQVITIDKNCSKVTTDGTDQGWVRERWQRSGGEGEHKAGCHHHHNTAQHRIWVMTQQPGIPDTQEIINI